MTGIVLPTASATRELGAALGGWLRAGDLVLLNGDLGAGKTTLTQGIAAGLGVTGDVISPTFVLAREHAPSGDGPGLVHVDAYRLGSAAEVDDMDLDVTFADVVTVVEWGRGLVEQLSDRWVEVTLDREAVAGSGAGEDPRVAHVALVGDWSADPELASRAAALAGLLRRVGSTP